ncbi:TonB-dependent receptor [Christiangramia sp. SM2212]|uniref:TonB-dependent receptor n=1 Tax=Christiangramia sediminicola TaxID=3073267 RepID=A0ABU1EU63_9FLAO|nr:TonB-dependent receptor [Christiangramia sp. SM2212]MDR5591934.1 TonB-dependent receptor [Christiangramia sp. SM2212]
MAELSEDEFQNILSIQNKCTRLNLNENIYGTFAEIGAGQETVRHFFRAGNPKGTIAKTLSAYDKDFSDAIYGLDPQNRYVTEARLKRMIDYEADLIEKRLSRKKYPNKLFFSYANTVATIDWAKKYKGHGWLGIKFQREPEQEYSEIILHVQFHENNASQQQISLGIMGVNLIYAAFYQSDDPKVLIKKLYDHLSVDKIEIDSINFKGPVFKNVDNRLMSLELVKEGITDAVMFSKDGNNILPANVLYKKNILTLRGSFRPVTNLNLNMFMSARKLFLEEEEVDPDKTVIIFEMTLNNLKAEGEIDEKDFLDRADLLCASGQTVMISSFQEYYKVVEYFSLHTKKQLGLAMGVDNLIDIFNEKYYRHLSGGILEAFGKLFFKSLKVYLYPIRDEETGDIINSKNLKVHPRVKELYKFFVDNGKVIDIEDYDEESLDIHPRKVYEMIREGDQEWENMVPGLTAKMIKEKNLFQEEKETQS